MGEDEAAAPAAELPKPVPKWVEQYRLVSSRVVTVAGWVGNAVGITACGAAGFISALLFWDGMGEWLMTSIPAPDKKAANKP
eukprot:g61047.t1